MIHAHAEVEKNIKNVMENLNNSRAILSFSTGDKNERL